MGVKASEWGAWRDDVFDYFDDIKSGMQEVMKWVLTCQEPPSLSDVVTYGAQMGLHDIAEDKKKIYRALKKLTDGIAKQVVVSTKDEDGYTAWHRFAGQFEPSLIAMMGEALSGLNGMSNFPAKTLRTPRGC